MDGGRPCGQSVRRTSEFPENRLRGRPRTFSATCEAGLRSRSASTPVNRSMTTCKIGTTGRHARGHVATHGGRRAGHPAGRRDGGSRRGRPASGGSRPGRDPPVLPADHPGPPPPLPGRRTAGPGRRLGCGGGADPADDRPGPRRRCRPSGDRARRGSGPSCTASTPPRPSRPGRIRWPPEPQPLPRAAPAATARTVGGGVPRRPRCP